MARVLIVDDSHDMLLMLQMLLEKRGKHQVIVAHDGQQALELAFAKPPDLALVDVMMPGMSGYDVVKRLRSDPRTEDMAILVLTARGQQVDKDAALASGADGHLSKPVNMDNLLGEVNALLEKKQTGGGGRTASPQMTGPMILPVLGLKGGVGVTTLSVNLAILLQKIAPTVLLDLSPNVGHCAIHLGMRPDKHWGHYVENPNVQIKTLLLEHSSGLKLFSAPPQLYQDEWFGDDDIVAILSQLKTVARFVLVDMPPVFDATAQFIMEQAYRIILVSGDDLPALQTTRATLQTLQTWSDCLILVRNTYTPLPHPPLEILQKALPVQISAEIPFDPAQSSALRKSLILAAVQPKSAFVNGIKRLAQVLLIKRENS